MFRLSKSDYTDQVVFKGGTSLSKGLDLIGRFSEDMDIAVINEEIDSGNQLEKLRRTIEKEITEGLKEISVENVTSKGSRFRKSVFYEIHRIYIRRKLRPVFSRTRPSVCFGEKHSAKGL